MIDNDAGRDDFTAIGTLGDSLYPVTESGLWHVLYEIPWAQEQDLPRSPRQGTTLKKKHLPTPPQRLSHSTNLLRCRGDFAKPNRHGRFLKRGDVNYRLTDSMSFHTINCNPPRFCEGLGATTFFPKLCPTLLSTLPIYPAVFLTIPGES